MASPRIRGQSFKVYLWFNTSGDRMRKRLNATHYNSGIGITIPRHARTFFNPDNVPRVELRFDDGTSGLAAIDRDKKGDSAHLVDDTIGEWARKRGLWKRKLDQRSVSFNMRVEVPYRRYYVYLK